MANDINFKVDADTSKATKGAEQLAQALGKAGKQAENTNQSLKESGNAGSRFSKVLGGLKFGAGLAVGKGLLDKVMGSLIENEKVANLFNDALSVITGTATGLVEILEPGFKAIGDAIKNPKKAWDDLVSAFERGAKWIKENLIDGVIGLFSEQINNLEIGILKLRKGWNEWTGDTEEAVIMQERINELQKENIEIQKEQSKRFTNIKEVATGAVSTLTSWGKTIAKNIKSTVEGNQALRDSTNAYITQNAVIEENIKSLERQQAQNEANANNETLTFEERRKSIEANIELKKQQIEQEKQLIQNQINLLALENQAKGVSAERSAQIGALNVQMKGLDATISETQITVDETLRTIAEQEKETTKAVTDALLEKNRAEAEAFAQTTGLEHEKLKMQLDVIEAQKKAFMQSYDERLSKEKEGTSKYNEILAERIAKEGEFNAQRIQGEAEYTTAIKEYKKTQQQMELDAMNVKAQAISQGLTLARTLIKEDSKMQSAINIAEAIMQTYVGANVALASSPPPLNYINMAGVIAGGLANVIKIQQEARKLASETGGSAPSGGSLTAPSIGPNISVARSNVDSNMQLGNAMKQAGKPPRAYVVSGDINSAESLDRKIYQNATLGG
jgi:hypothetical protein